MPTAGLRQRQRLQRALHQRRIDLEVPSRSMRQDKQGDLPTANVAIGLSKHPLRA